MIEANFIREYPDAISVRECEKLIAFYEKTVEGGNVFVSSGAEDNGNSLVRVDQAIYLQHVSHDINAKITEVVGECWKKYTSELAFLQSTSVVSYTSKLQKTPPSGGFHTWHWEHSGAREFRNRMAVWTLYLSDHEDEGETEFLAHGLKVKAEAGKFCIFPADYTGVHRGNPVYSKDKYIITGWYEYATQT